ncbi:terminase gpA endonuclease subunit [Zavarzinia sp.]|uniref:terminase gpA endonuclease subunit n=1 Tax=Zavarzinia sp. TaxID=2027920 RepID=UPI003BB4A35A
MGEYVDPGQLIADALEFALPPRRRPIPEVVEDLRYINGGGFRHDDAPYTLEAERVLSEGTHTGMAIIGPGQSGKTTIPENWFFASIAEDPASFLWYMPTDAMRDAYVKDRINAMIRNHDVLASRQLPGAINDSLQFKAFRGMNAHFLAANAGAFVSKNAPRIVADEIDLYAKSLGDPWERLEIRRQYYLPASIIVGMSHPDAASGLDENRGHWDRGIMAWFARSDRRLWYWPCPICNAVASPAPIASRRMVLDYDAAAPLDEIRDMARLRCPSCDELIEERHRRAMNAAGCWIGEGQTITPEGVIEGDLVRSDMAGFWIHGLMSPWTAGGWGGLAAARVEAERKLARGSENAERELREVMAKRWGEPYCAPEAVGSLEAESLRENAVDLPLRVVPEGFGALFASCDINSTWIEVAVGAFDYTSGESVVIDHFKVSAADAVGTPLSLARSPAHWQVVVDRVLSATYPMAGDPSRHLPIRGALIDSAGEAGVTDLAYAAWRAWSRADRGIVRRLGQNRHKVPVYTAMLSKGASTANPPRIDLTWPQHQRADRKVKALGDVPVLRFAPNAFKDTVATRLGLIFAGENADGTGDIGEVAPVTTAAIRLPAGLRRPQGSDDADFFEGVAAEARDKLGRWTRPEGAPRNEPLDLLVMLAVLSELFDIGRGGAAPAWASPDPARNSLARSETGPAGDDAMPALPRPAPSPAKPVTLARRLPGARR